AVRMRTATLYKVLAALMVLMAAALVLTHTADLGALALAPALQLVLLDVVPDLVLIPALAVVLLVSAVKLARHA
ncbi:hypothetical protein, partial [Actinosynnema sp.]